MHALEVSEKRAQRHLAVDLEAVPQRERRLVVLGLLGRHGLAEAEERQRQIHKAALVHLDVAMALHQLVHLDAVEADNERRGRCNRWYDAAGDELALVAIGGRDVVVLGAQVRARHDEVHVHVGVVVLLELDGHDDDGRARGGGRCGDGAQLGHNRVELILLEVGRVHGALRLRVVRVYLDALLGLEGGHVDAGDQLGDALLVATLRHAVHLGLQVGRREHVVEVGGVVARERERVRTPLGARPEGHAAARRLIARKVVEQLLDVVVVVLLPVEAGPAHALLERRRLVANKRPMHLQKLLERLRSLQLEHASDVRLRVLEEVKSRRGRVREQAFL